MGSEMCIRDRPDSMMLAHVATHPPGAVLFYYGARYLYEAFPFLQNGFSGLAHTLTGEEPVKIAQESNTIRLTASRSGGAKGTPAPLPVSAVGGAIWSAFLISFCLALATPAVYRIAASRHPEADEAEIVQAENRGLIAAALWALCPTANLFAFTLDAVIATGAAWTLVFLGMRWQHNQRGWLLACGITMALTSFVSFGALATGLILVVSTVYLLWQRDGKIDVAALVKEGLLIAIGFVLTWFFIIAIFPFSPLHVFGQAMEAHRLALSLIHI